MRSSYSANDGNLPVNQQPNSSLWAANGIGGSGTPISNGPFAWNPNDPKAFRVRVETGSSGNLRQTNRGLSRTLAQETAALPNKAATAAALAAAPYDASPWNRSSRSFRNQAEGWSPYGMHNQVHVWVGGDMLPAGSPNDPVFFLNHCNIDRVWEAWMQQHGRVYVPDQTAPASLKGHRINDQLSSLISPPTTPAAVLNSTSQYVYDTLAV